ncbi:MAG: phosphoribosyltransferase family protein [Desulfitobacteriaceae bacterium]
MKSITSQVCLPKKYTYSILGDQTVSLEIVDNPFNIPLETLVSMAARRNEKRGFLFVSKILGKHIPIDPYIGLLGGAALGAKFIKDIYNLSYEHTERIFDALITKGNTKDVYERVEGEPFVLPKHTLFIGFAETATALGHSMFSFFRNADFIHTTREWIPAWESQLNFDEEHSHAVEHRCYPLDRKMIENAEMVVLIDDELTTGKTALNFIKEIQKKFPKKIYIVVALLDWRNKRDRERFNVLEQELNIRIQTVSLLAGKAEISGKALGNANPPSMVSRAGKKRVRYTSKNLEIPNVVKASSEDLEGFENKSPFLKLTGRFGISERENEQNVSLAKEIGLELKEDRQGQKTCCLGTGEFMFFPMLVSAYMGDGVDYHSTTRSPIYISSTLDYAVKCGYSYPSLEEPCISTYLYNVPSDYYDEVYVFLERKVIAKRLEPMLEVLNNLGIPRIVFVVSS